MGIKHFDPKDLVAPSKKAVVSSVLEVCSELSPADILAKAKELGITVEPLDVERVAKEIFDVKVVYEQLSNDLSGFLEYHPGETRWYIYINEYENPRRQRFTLAHELAHLLIHNDIVASGYHDDVVMFRDNEQSVVEQEANEFASKLLMPKSLFEKYINSGNNTIQKLSEKFDLSVAAVKYRAYKLGYISSY